METRVRRLELGELLTGLAIIVAVNLLGSSPAFFVGSDTSWFAEPWFFPPGYVFSIVWTLLFTLMGIAIWLVWQRGTHKRAVRIALSLFAIQFVLNLAWTPAFFGLQRADLGLAVISILWVAIVATIVAFDRISRLAAALLVPYLAWVSFAIFLTYTIYAG
ncbi:tryptophan-rich sensory protein [Natronolimnobius sp. AArcel1]|uniref:TspO/MBR family protein n=1 Tax=Natronolimnobius sp. AArcel1 TaxID=1679093 RepID=UPI0013EDA2A8|nr:TspO/MBR family protein [Natronolimnobius sp. AArcel1]NGM69255.1 tryptophan-rich sensory protein [Natronolimnobius sp. AArcel1]